MTPEESARYWAAKKAQHQRALDFLAEARPGDTYRIERYALPQTGIPHELSEDADVHEKRVITLYAVHNGNGAYWFTTTTGEAIEAEEGLHFRVDEFLTGADFVLLEGRLIARFAGFRRHGWYNRSR